MRRTTQWAVFTSMNRQQPAVQSLYDPSEPARSTDSAADPAGTLPAAADPESRTAPHTRRDRVDFM